MKTKTKKILGVCLVVVLIAALAGAYFMFGEKPVEGSKAVVIEVVNSKGESTEYEVKTDAEYLHGAMDEAEGLTYDGEEGPYGYTVSVVNGESAVYETNGAYWAFYVNDEYCNYGIDSQPVNDGDKFSIVYTVAQ
ncbi:MAG: DUF4430 domain-containing protein [Clostridia bacterium]|nr:DUF4430 domain-containing protein [Clostridia bacterium]